MTQSFEVAPVQVWHEGEQGVHVVPPLKLPSGQTVPVEVMDCAASHLVLSLPSCVKPDLQAMQEPVPSAHCVQPSWHTKILIQFGSILGIRHI